MAAVARDLVLLEQVRDAARVLRHDLGLALEHARQIQLDARDLDAEVGQIMAGRVVALAGFEQRLAGDAADAHAGAAERFFGLDAGDVQAELRRADRRDVAAGTGTDHDQIMFFHVTPRAGCARVLRCTP